MIPDDRNSLEARIVAWVLGEASAFEATELERIVADDAELALFKRRIEAVHGLLGEAIALRPVEPWRLSPARRASVLAALGAGGASVGGEVAAPAPAAVVGSGARRRFAPEWKSLRLYFGVAAACMLVFAVVYQTTDRLNRTLVFSAPEPSAHRLEMERDLRLQAAEESKSLIEQRKAEQAMSRAEFEAELARREDELRLAERELRAMENDEPEARAFLQAMSPPVSSSAGAITVPVHRNIGSTRAAPGGLTYSGTPAERRRLSLASLDEEPETVPEGDENNRVELPLYEVSESADVGYVASDTLAGARIRPSLSDLNASITAVTSQYLHDDALAARPASTFGYNDVSSTEPSAPDAESTWTAGFAGLDSPADAPQRPNPAMTGGKPGAAVPGDLDLSDQIVSRSYFADTGAMNNETLLRYTTNTEVAGTYGNFSGNSATNRIRNLDTGDAAKDSFNFDLTWKAAVRPASVAPEKQADASDKKAEREPAPPSVSESIDEAHASTEPVSTFSLHVGDTSFKLALAALARGEMPAPGQIRPEEFYNAFDYGDPAPSVADKVACRIEQAAHPFLQQRALVRVAMKVAATGRGAGQPLRLTVLLDTSGSMEREDRVASVRRAMEVLGSLVGPDDRVSLIGFSRQPRLLAEAVRGDEASRLLDIISRTPADGGTNLEEALRLAEEIAQRHFEPSAQNRIVLMTDGAANLGNADPAQLGARIEALRGRGIAFDACGVGTDGLDDEVLEALTRRGDGRYYVVDTPGDADAGFARQLAGAFRPAAKNVKVQVRFNPARVGAYRLLGFEKHRLREEDFRNDAVDAAELAAEEGAVAVYQVEVLPEGEGELGDVFVRFRDMADGRMVERSWTIAHEPRLRALDQATPGIQLAGTAAMLAEVLRGGALADQIELADLAPVVTRLRNHYASQVRVQELATLFEQLRHQVGR